MGPFDEEELLHTSSTLSLACKFGMGAEDIVFAGDYYMEWAPRNLNVLDELAACPKHLRKASSTVPFFPCADGVLILRLFFDLIFFIQVDLTKVLLDCERSARENDKFQESIQSQIQEWREKRAWKTMHTVKCGPGPKGISLSAFVCICLSALVFSNAWNRCQGNCRPAFSGGS